MSVTTELVPSSMVMDNLLLTMARGKKIKESQIINAIEAAQSPHNSLENLYTDIKELHKTHKQKGLKPAGASGSGLKLVPKQKRTGTGH